MFDLCLEAIQCEWPNNPNPVSQHPDTDTIIIRGGAVYMRIIMIWFAKLYAHGVITDRYSYSTHRRGCRHHYGLLWTWYVDVCTREFMWVCEHNNEFHDGYWCFNYRRLCSVYFMGTRSSCILNILITEYAVYSCWLVG